MLEVRVPRSQAGFLRGIAKELGIHVLHRCMPWRLHRRARNPADDLANFLLARLEYDYYAHNIIKLFWGSLLGLNRAELLPPSPALAINYVTHANDVSLLAWRTRAAKYYEMAIRESEELNDAFGAALARNHYAFGCMNLARYREAIERAGPGKQAFAKLGDPWEGQFAEAVITRSTALMGNLGQAVGRARSLFESCVRRGDNWFAPRALYFWAHAAQGELPFDQLVECTSIHPGNVLGETLVLMAEGHWRHRRGDTASAVEACGRAWEIASQNTCVGSFNIFVLVEFVAALRIHATALEKTDPQQAARFRRRRRELVRYAARLSRCLLPTRPQALRELSLVHAQDGHIRKAWRLAARSCENAEKQEAAYEHAQSLRLQGQLARQLGLTGAKETVGRGEQALATIETALREALQSEPQEFR